MLNWLAKSLGLAQLCIGGALASYVGRLWALRISISVMIIGVLVFFCERWAFEAVKLTYLGSSKLFQIHMLC